MTSPPAKTAERQDLGLWNMRVLCWAQAVLGAQMPILIIIGGLAGAYLGSDPLYATLPISVQMLAAMVSAAPASFYMGRLGRRVGFLTGAGFGALGGVLGTLALIRGDFVMLCAAHASAGIYQTFQGYYRFAATDTASDDLRPRAVSWVLAAGLGAALLGPEIAQRTMSSFAPIPFAGAYAAIAVIRQRTHKTGSRA